MLKAKGKNQRMVREINQRLVLDSLVKGSKSCTDLAKELKLSNTAVAKIVGELRDLGLVRVDEDAEITGELGRKPIPFCLNPDFAVVAVADVCENSVLVSDMAGNPLKTRRLPRVNTYSERTIGKLVEQLAGLLAELPGKRLIAVCAITSGIVDSATGEYIFANRFENYKGINLQTVFKESFSVPVVVVNDTRAAMIAEQSYGLLQRATNAVLLSIDTGISAALLIGGVNYTGDKGFAGEVGLFQNEGLGNLESRGSLASVRQRVAEAARAGKVELDPGSVHTADVVAAFREGNAAVREIVLDSAASCAYAVRNLVHLLDCQIVIGGRVTEFGEEYLAAFTSLISECDYLNVKVRFSELSKARAGALGGTKLAIGLGLDTVLRR